MTRPHKSAVKRFRRHHQLPESLQRALEQLIDRRVDLAIRRWLREELYREEDQ